MRKRLVGGVKLTGRWCESDRSATTISQASAALLGLALLGNLLNGAFSFWAWRTFSGWVDEPAAVDLGQATAYDAGTGRRTGADPRPPRRAGADDHTWLLLVRRLAPEQQQVLVGLVRRRGVETA